MTQVCLDLESLDFAAGSQLLIKRALRQLPPGARLGVRSADPHAAIHLRAWCRDHGHQFEEAERHSGLVAWIVRGTAIDARHAGATRSGQVEPDGAGAVHGRPELSWGFAARGAMVEAGGAPFPYPLARREQVWAASAPRLHAQAVRGQWNPDTALDWTMPFEIDADLEHAVVQVMTYLIENENAALQVPARFIAQIHPHFREVLQLLALQLADEARHVDVFTRRAALRGSELGLSTVGGQESLRTLLEEPDFAVAGFLLSVMGEGTFLNLLRFLELHAPDPLTAQIARLVAQDEARHVAFGMGHLQYQLQSDPSLRDRLALAIARRHEALARSAGLNEEVFDSLVLLAAGSWRPADLAAGHGRVQGLVRDMHSGRRARLEALGFGAAEASELAALHTRNFM